MKGRKLRCTLCSAILYLPGYACWAGLGGRLSDRRNLPHAASSTFDLLGDALVGVLGKRDDAFLPAYEVGRQSPDEVDSAWAGRLFLRMRGIRKPSSVSADQLR